MPLKRCSNNDKSGWKWGDSGKCYTGPGAKKKAIRQGVAIEGPEKFASKAGDEWVEMALADAEIDTATRVYISMAREMTVLGDRLLVRKVKPMLHETPLSSKELGKYQVVKVGDAVENDNISVNDYVYIDNDTYRDKITVDGEELEIVSTYSVSIVE